MRSARDLSILGGILTVALVFRLPGHLDSGLWYDEIWLLLDTLRQPFSTFYTTFGSDNNHPFYSLLAWLSVHSLGETAWALRLPALAFGVGSIGLLWIVALRVTTRRQAAIVTALMTISYHHVWFSQNARGYTMLLFWTLAATHFLLKVYDGEGRRSWIWYASCLALATYTHASALAIAFAHGLLAFAIMVSPSRRTRLTGFWHPVLGLVLAGALSLLLHASILTDMIGFFRDAPLAPVVESEASASEWNSAWWTVRAAASSLGLGLVPGLLALAASGLVLLVGTWDALRKDWRVAGAFVLPAMVGIAMTVGMGRPLRPRFLFNVGGFGLIILVGGVFQICSWIAARGPLGRREALPNSLQRAATVLMVALSLAILPRAYLLPKQDFEGARAWVEEARRSDELVLTTGLTVLPYQRYYGDDYPEVTSTEELESALSGRSAVYVLHTLPIYLDSRAPDLAKRLAGASEVARFKGSLGGGDIIVLKIDAPGR